MSTIPDRRWIRVLSGGLLIGLAIGGASSAAHAAPRQTLPGKQATPYVGLVAGPTTTDTAAPGGRVTGPVTVGSSSTAAILKPIVRLDWSYALTPAKTYDNCFYGERSAYCVFDTEVAPGTAYELDPKLQYDVRADTYAPSRAYSTYSWYTTEEVASRLAAWRTANPNPGTGGPLKLTATSGPVPQADSLPRDSILSVKIIGDNPGDLVAVGAKVRGAVGETVKLQFSMKNVGPATIDFNNGSTSVERFTKFTVPMGTTVVAVPKGCASVPDGNPAPDTATPGSSQYLCYADSLIVKANDAKVWEFGLRIDKAGETKGSIETNYDWQMGGRHGKDANLDNDTAEIVVNEGTPTGSGSAGSGSTGGGTTGGDVTSGTAAGGSGGGLPITGPKVTVIAGSGVALVVLGALGYVLTRRRRASRFVA